VRRLQGPVPGQLSLLACCLDAGDRSVLAFARAHHFAGRVEDALTRRELGVSATRYFQLLVALLERPETADAEPELVGQLCALRHRRQRLRLKGSGAGVGGAG